MVNAILINPVSSLLSLAASWTYRSGTPGSDSALRPGRQVDSFQVEHLKTIALSPRLALSCVVVYITGERGAVTKTNIVEQVVNSTGMSKKEAYGVVECFFDTLKATLVTGEAITDNEIRQFRGKGESGPPRQEPRDRRRDHHRVPPGADLQGEPTPERGGQQGGRVGVRRSPAF